MDNPARSASENSGQSNHGTQPEVSSGWPVPADYGLGLVCIHSLDGQLLSVSPAGAKALGYEPQEMVGRPMRDFLPEDVRDKLPAYLDRIQREGTASGFLRVCSKSGDERILAYSNIYRQERDKPGYVLGHAADVTELKKAEQTLRAAEQRSRYLMQCSSEVVAISTADGCVQYASPAIERTLGYSPAEIVGRNIFDYVHPDDVAAARATFAAAVQKPGYSIPVNLHLRAADDSHLLFDITTNNLLDTPAVAGVVIAARENSGRTVAEREFAQQRQELEQRDRRRAAELAATNRILVAEIRDREQTEKALRESESLLQAALESTADGILVVDLHGKIVTSNRRFAELWGIPEQVLSRRNDEETIAFVLDQLKFPSSFLTNVHRLYQNPEESSFDVLEFKNGRVFERYSQPQKILGKTVGRVWSFRDVTERKSLEEHFRQAQKMEAIGRLAGGVAHDFNNLLMVIMGHCNELLRKRDEPIQPSAKENVEHIFAAAERAASLTRQLLAFSRKQVLTPRVLDINVILTELSTMLPRLIGEDIELLITLSDTSLYVEADPAQLDQVIFNLVVNARDAMPRGGTLSVNAGPVQLREARTKGAASVPPGNYVLLTVTDTGVGIADETLPRIFEPFFTTKEPGRGTGLGLSTAYGVVRQSRGHILVESEMGRGTTFEIYLPRLEASSIDAADASVPARSCRGSETILVVEDEVGIRALTKTYLEQLGYTVMTAANAADALSLASSYAQPIHLLLSDVIMPGMRGTDLANLLLNDRPRMQILYVSGYPEEEISDPTIAFLLKPFPMEELGAKIRQLLDKSHASSAA